MKASAGPSDVTLRLTKPLCLSNGFVEVGVLLAEGNVRKRLYVRIYLFILNSYPGQLNLLCDSGLVLGLLKTEKWASCPVAQVL